MIAREETHVSWLQHALLDLGAAIPPDPSAPDVKPTRKGNEGILQLSANDASENQRFVEKWRERVEPVTNARHKGMLEVILGEMLEHKRLFEQAASGRQDLIGKSLDINDHTGVVMATRWTGD